MMYVSASPFSLFFSLFGAIDFSVLKVKFCVLNSISCSPKRAELKTEIIAYNGDYVSIVVCFLTSVLCVCVCVSCIGGLIRLIISVVTTDQEVGRLVAGGEPFVIPVSSVNSSPSPDPPHASQTLSSPAAGRGNILCILHSMASI